MFFYSKLECCCANTEEEETRKYSYIYDYDIHTDPNRIKDVFGSFHCILCKQPITSQYTSVSRCTSCKKITNKIFKLYKYSSKSINIHQSSLSYT